MATAAARERRSERDARAALRERLEARREEIEAAALTRVRAISEPTEISDPAYVEGLRAAVAAAVAYGIETTGREGADAPIPVALLAQARMAARVGIPLDTVLRRYFAGYSLLGYFILEEATHAGLTDGAELKRLLGAHAGLFDRLLAAIGEEHARESESLALATGDRRRAEKIERLLAGEQLDISEIPYDFEGWHVGLVAVGATAKQAARELADNLDCRPMILSREDEEETVWIWLGSRRHLDPADLMHVIASQRRGDAQARPKIALGEPAEGLAGWRLTHRQAAATLSVARRGPEPVVRYAEVALHASIAQDDLLATSLRRLYLEPLTRGQRDGAALLETLRAYIASGGNASSAAASLGISRQAVAKRLRSAEMRVGRPLQVCLLELDAALRLADLDPRRK